MDEHSPTTASRIFRDGPAKDRKSTRNDKSRQVRNAERQTVSDLRKWPLTSGAGDGNRTRTTSLEGWSSTIELRPRVGQA